MYVLECVKVCVFVRQWVCVECVVLLHPRGTGLLLASIGFARELFVEEAAEDVWPVSHVPIRSL